ncbi:hypothetical protein JYU34_002345 [Plutella xylostella]|uniref:Dipeptidase E n=1 Tax=Plutella xylostella TaxID=51655 RepID=A0ABQ7R1Y7_PLUXY|nr:hypothetical protein JYU34_002345 [Plutella xylostella]
MKWCRQALLLSSSTLYGYPMLEFAKHEICSALTKHGIKEFIFVPYARKNYNWYTSQIKAIIEPWGFHMTGLHTYPNPVKAINASKAIFVGGGNSFLLLKTLYELNLVATIKKRVLQDGMLYIGSSAGTNVATIGIHTTNDMPIVYPPSLNGIGIVQFNINPHYIDPVESVQQQGDIRDINIRGYLKMEHSRRVIGMREGANLEVDGEKILITGINGAVLFEKNGDKIEYPVGSDVSFMEN